MRVVLPAVPAVRVAAARAVAVVAGARVVEEATLEATPGVALVVADLAGPVEGVILPVVLAAAGPLAAAVVVVLAAGTLRTVDVVVPASFDAVPAVRA